MTSDNISHIVKDNYFSQECSFVRCIKPISSQCSGIFDESLVRSQLISSGSIAYQQLMKIGFPSHMSISNLFDMFKSNTEFTDYTSKNPKEFCKILLRSCGFNWKDFKLVNTQIFFRSGKLETLSKKLEENPKILKQRLDKLKILRKKFKMAIISARFCVIGKGRCKNSIDFLNKVQPEEANIPRKKIKLNKKSSQLLPYSEQTEGNENE